MQLFTVQSDTWQMHTLPDVMIFTDDTLSCFLSPGDTCGMTLLIHAHGTSFLHLSPDDRKAYSVSSTTQSPPCLPMKVLGKFCFHEYSYILGLL